MIQRVVNVFDFTLTVFATLSYWKAYSGRHLRGMHRIFWQEQLKNHCNSVIRYQSLAFQRFLFHRLYGCHSYSLLIFQCGSRKLYWLVLFHFGCWSLQVTLFDRWPHRQNHWYLSSFEPSCFFCHSNKLSVMFLRDIDELNCWNFKLARHCCLVH